MQENLFDRVCPFCGLYFASMKNAKEHRKNIHAGQRATNPKRKTSTRIIKRRENEVLCEINKDDAQDVEWLKIEDVINTERINSPKITKEEAKSLPTVISMIDWLRCDWEDEI